MSSLIQSRDHWFLLRTIHHYTPIIHTSVYMYKHPYAGRIFCMHLYILKKQLILKVWKKLKLDHFLRNISYLRIFTREFYSTKRKTSLSVSISSWFIFSSMAILLLHMTTKRKERYNVKKCIEWIKCAKQTRRNWMKAKTYSYDIDKSSLSGIL